MPVQAAGADPTPQTAKVERHNDAPRARSDARSSSTPAVASGGTRSEGVAHSKSAQRPSQYRLFYDNEFSRVFVQVVDRESGEEILRFPPEELVRFIDNSIDQAQRPHKSSGLFLDRVV
jgi:uncharacterized FlaG/YvyC family protein